MENASKALLIAGAVLIVILLIGIGMLIYSKSTGVIDTAASSMNSYEIQMFNSQFTAYEGEQKNGSVKSLIQAIAANNATYKGNSNKIVQIIMTNKSESDSRLSTFSATTSEQISNNIIQNLKTTSIYKVTFEYGTSGYISIVDLTEI